MIQWIKKLFLPKRQEVPNQKMLSQGDNPLPDILTPEEAYVKGLEKEMAMAVEAMNQYQQAKIEAMQNGDREQFLAADQALHQLRQTHHTAQLEHTLRKPMKNQELELGA